MAEYHGMQWFKCDLQVQTPEDAKHWDEPMLQLQEPRTEADLQEKARAFLRRCHELELEVIGITDHNFSSRTNHREWFLTHLIEQNNTVAQQLGRSPIWIFPGFEIDIGYHLLCLFDPVRKGQELVRVNDLLTTLGLAPAARFDGGKPNPLRHEGAVVPLRTVLAKIQKEGKGIVIAAHAFSNRGICDDSSHMGDYKNQDLLCVEVSDYPLKTKAKQVLEGLDASWRRSGRLPAFIMSSDAKSFKVDEDGLPIANSLSYRFSWLKMSQPSIEALRQAFLDNDSRIELPADPRNSQKPSAQQTHPRIRSLRISGLDFLKDQDIAFSPNLNCLIGGRGSGKSTLLECLRLGLGKEAANSLKVKEKLDRLQGLFTANTTIQVEWEGVPGQMDELMLRPKQGEHRLLGMEPPDFQTYLRRIPVQFFSQQQLSELTGSSGGNRLLQLIDEACAGELQSLVAEERTVRTEIQQLFAARDQHEAVKGNIARLKQELAELDRQWQARKDVQLDAQAHQRAQQAKGYLSKLRARFAEEAGRLRSLSEDIGEALVPLGSEASHWPHADWFQALEVKLEALSSEVQEKLGQVAAHMESGLQGFIDQDPQWPAIEKDLASAETRFLEACRERGLQPQDVTRLQEIDRQRQGKQGEITAQEKQEKQLLVRIQAIPERLAALKVVWHRQFELRLGAAQSVNDKVNGAIRVSVLYSADVDSFTAAWERLSPDRRSKLGRNWDELGRTLFTAFLNLRSARVEDNQQDGTQSIERPASPWELAQALATGEADFDTSLPFFEYTDDLGKHLQAIKNDWLQARLTRVADWVDIELFRLEDGKSAGKVGDKRLSEGQRNTAVLNLLLAQGDGPIVIDQPEDELDSNFIYRDLVPLLRRVKDQRQVILATHNANLPVNGDAELIFALEARGEHGDKRADGGLDRAEVTSAVLDIMEGSAEAFRRRREKYHF